MSDHTQHTHGYGFNDDGEPVRIAEFPHDEVAARLDGETGERRAHHEASVAVASVLGFALSRKPGGGRNPLKEAMRGAAARVLAMAWVWRDPSTHEFTSIHTLAKAYGVKHSQLHNLARQYAQKHGIPLEIVRKRWGGND